jgi:vesicle-associated membrane protein 4
MHQVSTDGKLAMVNQQLNTTKEIMVDNINLALANQESIEELNDQAENLNIAARQFKKKAKQVKRFQMVQNAKHGVLVGTVVTAGVAAVIVPPLVAIL